LRLLNVTRLRLLETPLRDLRSVLADAGNDFLCLRIILIYTYFILFV
jgi:hypothetical protein